MSRGVLVGSRCLSAKILELWDLSSVLLNFADYFSSFRDGQFRFLYTVMTNASQVLRVLR